MLNYEEFAEAFKERVSEGLNEKPEKGILEFMKKQKINREVEGISFRVNGSNIAPCIYIQNFYETYQRDGDLDAVVREAVELLYEKRDVKNIETPEFKPGMYGDRIFFQLINTEKNKEMLKDIPHREIEDLSVVYRVLSGSDDYSMGSFIVTNSMAKSLALNEEQLYAKAYENTREIMKPTIRGMEEMLAMIMKARGMDEDQVDLMLNMYPTESGIYVLTNNCGAMGATSMLYTDLLDKIADKVNDDLMILPSSLHEVLAIRASGASPEDLRDMVCTINATEVDVSDLLSDNVYYYDREARTLTIAGSERKIEKEETEHSHSGR